MNAARSSRRWLPRLSRVFLLLCLPALHCPGDPLEAGFQNPPASAQPRTWWHWTSGNVTKEGITKDLEWMKRVGIGGFQLCDVAFGGNQSVEKKIQFGTPDWYDAIRHAAAEADRLGLEMSIFSSAGWSETGGPWVKPEQAMKKLVWSEIQLEGPRSFNGKIPQPPSNNGPIRNLGRGGAGRAGAPPDPTYFGDSAVLAFRTPPDEINMTVLNPKVATSRGAIDGKALMDDDLNSSVTIGAPEDGGPAWVQYEFPQPFKARAITLAGPGRGIPVGRILAGDDGTNWQTLAELPGTQQYRTGTVRTFAFPEVSARIFRVEMTGLPLDPAATMAQGRPRSADKYSLSEFVVHTGARVHRAEEKAGFSFLYNYDDLPTPPVPASAAIARADLIDLGAKMTKDGTLQWDVPPGKWTILRLGYSLTGAKNRPAPPTGSGYEVDKLSRKHVEAYFHGYVDPLEHALGPLLGKSLRYVTMDSWEAGMQNWTDDMIPEFRKRRGYDPTPWLPALTGRVVENAELTDRFLWDFRRTLADMFADNHYGTMAELLRQKGVGIYAEAAGVSMEVLEDTLLNKSKVDVPMGEFWVRALHPELQYYVDVRGAASASHAYGKTLVAAESFTGGGYEAPFTLKKIGDYWFARGVNRIVFHTSAHQPLDTIPGNTMVGTHINRNITWAEQAGPFMTYLARTSYLLQQGLFVADLAYLLPEGPPTSQPFWGPGLQPPPPEGYDYDCLNADVLLHRAAFSEGGRLVLSDGMSYRVLVLPRTDRMTPPLLRKIRQLVAGGVIIVGPKPAASPSLANYPKADREVRELADEIWGDLDGVTRNRHYYGNGVVYWNWPLTEVLAAAAVPGPRDFEYAGSLDAHIAWIHRRVGVADIYFVANCTDQAEDLETRFRVIGKTAELWHPDTGAIEPADYSIAQGRTTVPLHLAERESVFVVFRQLTTSLSRTLPAVTTTNLATITGPWDITFPPNLGAPPAIQLARLESWTANTNAGVKYFSGTATYTTTLQAEPEWFRSQTKLLLDLGTVKDLAEVSLNGKSLGILWKPPYHLDITGVLKPGPNQLEVKVTNEWTNRQIGDRSAAAEDRVLSSPAGFGSAATPPRGTNAPARSMYGAGGPFGRQTLSDAGLLGPVTVLAKTTK